MPAYPCRAAAARHALLGAPALARSHPPRTNSFLRPTLRPLGPLEHTSASAWSHLSVQRQTLSVGYRWVGVNDSVEGDQSGLATARSRMSAPPGLGFTRGAGRGASTRRRSSRHTLRFGTVGTLAVPSGTLIIIFVSVTGAT